MADVTQISISCLSEADYRELVRLGNMKPKDLRSALSVATGATLISISGSRHWDRGEMIAHLFNRYLNMKAND